MQPSRITTLFSEPPTGRRGPSVFLVSILLHAVAIGLIYFGLRHAVRVVDTTHDRYTVRMLNLRRPEVRRTRQEQAGSPDAAAMEAPGGGLRSPQPSPAAPGQGGRPAAPSLPMERAEAIPAPQTLVQPDLPPNMLLPKAIPIPLVVLWSPDNHPVKQIVPSPPQPATAAKVHPSLETPNREAALADLKIAASAFVTKMPSVPPSTTTPLVVHGPAAARPATASKPLGPPTPARVISLSSLQLEQGTIALPLVNETAPAGASVILLPGVKSAGSTGGKPAAAQAGNSAGHGAGAGGTVASGSGTPGAQRGGGAGGALVAVSGNSSGGVPDSGSSATGEPLSLTRIDLPKDGKFGVVVVGSSLAEEYPETVGLWSGRLAYTVYLHVGLAKSWILQYSLPRSAAASVAGEAARPEAPWPYQIERPHFAPGDIDADAVMVHGFVNMAGRFEHLAVVFPPEFAQSKFVLKALAQWQFRPALENGKLATVEVLLIIPEQEQ